jgi:type IV secretory pathway TrbL component
MGDLRMLTDPTTAAATLLFRLALVAVAIVLALMFFGKIERTILAGPKAELAASRGNQAASKGAIDEANAATKGRAAEGTKRKAESAKAVAEAGKGGEASAAAIRAAPAVGDTDYERAMNRIDRELGLK